MSKQNIFSILYALNIVCLFGFGMLRIPGAPLNFYQITGLVLIFYCAFIDHIKFWDKYQVLFWLFMAFYGLSSFVTGFGKVFLSSIPLKCFQVVSICWATKLLITKYNAVLPLLLPVFFIAVLNSVVTVCQCYHLPYFDSISMLLGNTMEDKMEYMERRDIFFGRSLNGIFSNSVDNGHNSLFFFLCSLYPLKDRISVSRLVVPLISLVGLFFCQQRAAFYLALIGIVFVLFALSNKQVLTRKQFMLALFVAFVFLLFYNDSILDALFGNDYRNSRIFEMSSTGREGLNDFSLSFIFSHLLFGGHYQYVQEMGMAPHNVLFDAFISGGIIGGCILCYLIIVQTILVIQSRNDSIGVLLKGVIFLGVLGDSFFHNSGYVQADPVLWLSWYLFCCSLGEYQKV